MIGDEYEQCLEDEGVAPVEGEVQFWKPAQLLAYVLLLAVD